MGALLCLPFASTVQLADGESLRGFSIDGKTEIEALIKNDTIIIPTKEKPAFIYYAWKSFTNANLVNVDKLPASTFKIKVQ